MKYKGIHFTHHTNGKMSGLVSLNTSSLNNDFCKKKSRNRNNICHFCYSTKYEKLRKNLEKAYLKNGLILKRDHIEIPVIPYRWLRVNSFGELINISHLDNIVQLARKNDHCTFSLFTKRLSLLNYYFYNNNKPKNLIVIYSTTKLNKVLEYNDLSFKNKKIIDKVFSVTNQKDLKINCTKNCFECMKCYTEADPNNTIVEFKK